MASASLASLPHGRFLPAQCVLFALLVAVDFNQQATPAAIAKCPARCRCDRNTTHIRCIGLNLTSVLNDLPTSSHILVLSDNRIAALHNSTFYGLTEMTSLTLTGNRINRIESGSFAPLTNIRVLLLNVNRIRNIQTDSFATNTLLTEVDLSDNELTSVEAHLLNRLTRLRTLNLANNRLTSFASGTFTGLGLLRTLDISGNSISALETGIFASLLSLTFLNVSKMALQSLNVSAFPFPSAVQTLDTSCNLLSIFDASHFDRFHNLRHLNLSANPLACDCRAVALRRWLAVTHFGVAPSTARASTTCAQPQTRAGSVLFQFPVTDLTCARNKSAPAELVVLRHYNVMEPSKYANGYTLSEYDPKIGWYTAGTLSAMLIGFLLCIALDKLKRIVAKRRKRHAGDSRNQSVVRKHTAPSGGDNCSTATPASGNDSRSLLRVERIGGRGKHRQPGQTRGSGSCEQNRMLDGGYHVLHPSRCGVDKTGREPNRARSHDDSGHVTPRPRLARQAASVLPQDFPRQTCARVRADGDAVERVSAQTLSIRIATEEPEGKKIAAPPAGTASNVQPMLCVVRSDASRWRYRAVSPTPTACVEVTGVSIASENDHNGLSV